MRQSNLANSALVGSMDPRDLFLSGLPHRQPKVSRYKHVLNLYRKSYKYVLFCVGRGRSVECRWGTDTHLVPRHETLRSEIVTSVLARESKWAEILVASVDPRESFLGEWSCQLGRCQLSIASRKSSVTSLSFFCTDEGRVTGKFSLI